MIEFLGKYIPGMNLADLHIHTTFSRDVKADGLTPSQVVEMATKRGLLNAIAITDHDTVEGVKEAEDYALEIGSSVEVIPGIEVSTKEGHLLGLYVKENIPKGKSLEWTIDCIKEQDGLVVIPHFDFSLARSIKRQILIQLLANGARIDGFEVFNRGVRDVEWVRSRGNGTISKNDEGLKFFLDNQVSLGAAIGSSDNHRRGIGRGLTGYRGDLRQAIKDGQTSVFFLDHIEQLDLLRFSVSLFGSPKGRNRFLDRGVL